MKNKSGWKLTGLAVAIFIVSIFLSSAIRYPASQAAEKADADASAAAYLKAYKVFMHPRCMNCHPAGDRPLQGDDSHIHTMNVRRGPEGLGKDGLWCSTCHQDKNQPGVNMPPGAPGWQLPTADMPMVFQNKTAHDLCEQMKDPARNGDRSPEEVLEHVRDAPIVLWGWRPGEGRSSVPISHEEFVNNMTEWVRKGAACPR